MNLNHVLKIDHDDLGCFSYALLGYSTEQVGYHRQEYKANDDDAFIHSTQNRKLNMAELQPLKVVYRKSL